MNGQAMLALQVIDSALDQVVHRRARLPELAARAAHAETLKSLQDRIDAADHGVAEALALIEQSEHAADEITLKRERLERQLKTVISPREAEALMVEITRFNSMRSDLDDRELAALEAQAEGELQADELRALLPPVQAELDAADEALAAARAALDAEEAQLRADRVAAAEVLGAGDLATYERLRTQFHGVGIAKLEVQRCAGCHLDLSRAEVDVMRALPADTMPECPQCGRYLVR